MVIDAAHNVASIDSLVEELDQRFSERNGVLVFATSRDKDIEGMLRRLLPRFSQVIFTRYGNNPRGVDPAELTRVARPAMDALSDRQREAIRFAIRDDPGAAWQLACEWAGADNLICVTGSFFIAAEIRELALSTALPEPPWSTV